MKTGFTLLLMLFGASGLLPAQSWVTVGNPDFSAGGTVGISLAIDNNTGTPYVAYVDNANGTKASVMKYNGTNWVYVGRPGFSTSWINYASIAIAPDGTPYIAYEDWSYGGKISVLKFADTGWAYVGNPGFSRFGVNARLAISKSGAIFLSYNLNPGAMVMEYVDTGWAYVGRQNFAAAFYQSIALASDGTPYVAFKDEVHGNASVMMLKDTGWAYVGNPGFGGSIGAMISIAVDDNNVPYVGVEGYLLDSSIGYSPYPAYAMRFVDTVWQSMGLVDRVQGLVRGMIVATWGGVPYIVYGNDSENKRLTVNRYDGAEWQPLGDSCFSPPPYNLSFAVWNGEPFVALVDQDDSSKLTVMTTGSWLSVRTPTSEAETFTIYPNPNNGTFTVGSSGSGGGRIVITDVLGKMVKTIQHTQDWNSELSVTVNAPPGTYFVTLIREHKAITQKIVIE